MPGGQGFDGHLALLVSLRAAVHHFVEHSCFDASTVPFHVDRSPVLWLVFVMDRLDFTIKLVQYFLDKCFRAVPKRVVLAEQFVEFFEELSRSGHELGQKFL